MIKWPKPVGTVTDDIQMFWTSFGLNEDTPKGTKVHTEAQLKQAVRDAYEDAAKAAAPKTPRPCACDCGNQDDAQRVAEWDAENAAASAIRALIKEIPE